MAIKNLIVLTDSRPTCANRIQIGLLMARKYDAHLTGIYIRTRALMPSQALELLPSTDRQAIEKNLDRKGLELVEQTQKMFEDACTAAGRSDKSHWIVVRGEADHVAGAVARYADLTIVGQRDESHEFVAGVDPDHVVFDSGRPMLIVPDEYSPPSALIEHAVVGWDGGRECARALSDAMLILETKSKVSVVSVGRRSTREKEFGLDVVEHLQRHGIETERVALKRKKSDPGLDLLRYAEEVGAGLLVMGAYSRSRLREQILGGATHSVLDKMTIPVFMSH